MDPLSDDRQLGGSTTDGEPRRDAQAGDSDPSALAETLPARDAATSSLHDDVKARLFGGDGRRIGRFEVERPLGRGAMGSVYAARDPELDRLVAVKVLAPGALMDDDAEPRLRREARALAKLSDPHVVPVYEVGSHGGQLFVAMEYVEGSTLRQWASASPRGWRASVEAYLQAARGLAAAHAAGLVHRDFKPDNAMIGADGRVRVVDFGLATAQAPADTEARADPDTDSDDGAPRSRDAELGLTDTGTLMGTPAYMAPEQFLGRPADAASDQYAWCASLFEALAGRRPVEAESFTELMRKTIEGAADLQLPREVPGWLAPLMRRGLATEPTERHPSMQALVGEVERRIRPRRRVAWALGGLAAVAAIVALAQRQPPPPPPSTAEDDDACARTLDEARAAWSPTVRDAYGETTPNDVGRTWMPDELAWLDLRMDRWREDYAAVCAAPPDDEGAVLARRCLEADLAQFDAMVRVALDARVAMPSTLQLAPLARCAPEHAARDLGPPPGGDWREVAQLRRALQSAVPTPAIEARIEALDYPPLTVELALAQAEVELDEQRVGEALSRLERAEEDAAACGHERALAEIRVQTAVGRGMQGKPDAHAAAVERAARALDRVAPYDPRLAGVGRLRLAGSHPEEAHAARLAQLDAAIAAASPMPEQHPDRWLLDRDVGAMRVLELTKLGRTEEADAAFVETSERMLSHLEGADPEERLNALTEQGVMAYSRGDLDRSRRLLSEAYAEAVALGGSSYQMLTANNLSFIEGERGDWVAALEHAETAVAMARKPRDGPDSPEGLPTLLHSQAQILARLDRCDEARPLLRESLALDEQPARRVDLAACAMVDGDLEAARSEADAAYTAIAADDLARGPDALAIPAAAQIANGRASEAAARIDVPAVLLQDPHGRLRRALAAALEATKRYPVRVERLREEATGAEEDPSPFMAAFDRVAFGEAEPPVAPVPAPSGDPR